MRTTRSRLTTVLCLAACFGLAACNANRTAGPNAVSHWDAEPAPVQGTLAGGDTLGMQMFEVEIAKAVDEQRPAFADAMWDVE